MGKQKNTRRELDNEAKVVLRNIRVSPQKLNLVAQMIRKQGASKAISILQFSKRRISNDVEKALRSAIANAEHNQGLDVDSLFVSTVAVDESFTMKRIRARARGRADRYFKRSCNISLTLEEKGK